MPVPAFVAPAIAGVTSLAPMVAQAAKGGPKAPPKATSPMPTPQSGAMANSPAQPLSFQKPQPVTQSSYAAEKLRGGYG